MKKNINIGIFGLGTVGKGVVEQLTENREIIAKRTGCELTVVKAVTANPDKDRGLNIQNIQISKSPRDIINDPSIDIIVELIGGEEPAKWIVLESLKKGKSVVTANKALLAEHASEIFNAAYQAEGFFGYEASVAGGIPIIRNIKDGFSGDKIEEISGIINGTANYILTKMTLENANFDETLKIAQEKGYAETDPTFDIDGIDTAHKLAILMSVAFNGIFDFKQLYIEGIRKIEPMDIEIADEFGYTIKLLGKALPNSSGFEGRVHPSLVSKDSILASVNWAFNAVSIRGNYVGPTLAYGAGAGSHPTASAVVGDIIEISRLLNSGTVKAVSPLSYTGAHISKQEILPIEIIQSEYYLRFTVLDEVGVLAKITSCLGNHKISIRSMIQKSETHTPGLPVPVVIFTHTAKESNIQKALKEIDGLPFVSCPTKLIRIDE